MPRLALATLLIPAALAGPVRADDPADLIVHNAKVVTVDAKFTTAEAVAVRGGQDRRRRVRRGRAEAEGAARRG